METHPCASVRPLGRVDSEIGFGEVHGTGVLGDERLGVAGSAGDGHVLVVVRLQGLAVAGSQRGVGGEHVIVDGDGIGLGNEVHVISSYVVMRCAA